MLAVFERLPMPATLLVCVAIAAFLVYLPFFAVGVGRLQIGYNPSTPRADFEKLPDYAKRATWAHQNAFEAFGLFAAAALMAYFTQQTSSIAALAAIAHILARTLYPLFYILDLPWLRSLMFGVGSLSTFTLFALSIQSALLTSGT